LKEFREIVRLGPFRKYITLNIVLFFTFKIRIVFLNADVMAINVQNLFTAL